MARCDTCQQALARERQPHRFGVNILDARPRLRDYFNIHAQMPEGEIPADRQFWMCHRCWVAADRHAPAALEQHEAPPVPIPIAGYRRAANAANVCVFPDCRNVDNLRRIPELIKMKIVIDYKIYIPPLARVCQDHFVNGDWGEGLMGLYMGTFNSEQLEDMMRLVTTVYHEKQVFNFDKIEDICPAELHYCIGLTHAEFDDLLQQAPSLAQTKRPKTALGAYLMKLRTGEPNERLAARLSMSRRALERLFEKARQALIRDFVPNHLGWDHISREEIIANNLAIPYDLYGELGTKAIVIFDGTYIYIQKSTNFSFQKKTYSLHKHCNLIKPFMVVCPNGYIIDVTGPHAATTSDADIMRQELREDSPMNYALQAGDVFVVDRGFRNAIPIIEECGYEVHMPPTKRLGETQLNTEDANKSRLVTILRWVVEVINGRLKRDFKLLRQEYNNRSLLHAFDDVRVAAALTNVFKEPLADSRYANEIIELIGERREQPNRLAEYVTENNLNRQRAAFQNINDAVILERTRFPQMTMEDLILIGLGTYQIKLARSYLSEQIRDGIYQIQVCENDIPELMNEGIGMQGGVLLRGRIKSRLTGNKKHYSYILIDNVERGRQAIKHYYCSCLTGRRTIGTCAHIMSIIWYLGWAKYQNVLLPALLLDEVILRHDNI